MIAIERRGWRVSILRALPEMTRIVACGALLAFVAHAANVLYDMPVWYGASAALSAIFLCWLDSAKEGRRSGL